MKKGELRELYQMMFPEYPDIVRGKQSVRLSSPKRLYLRAAARTH